MVLMASGRMSDGGVGKGSGRENSIVKSSETQKCHVVRGVGELDIS